MMNFVMMESHLNLYLVKSYFAFHQEKAHYRRFLFRSSYQINHQYI